MAITSRKTDISVLPTMKIYDWFDVLALMEN